MATNNPSRPATLDTRDASKGRNWFSVRGRSRDAPSAPENAGRLPGDRHQSRADHRLGRQSCPVPHRRLLSGQPHKSFAKSADDREKRSDGTTSKSAEHGQSAGAALQNRSSRPDGNQGKGLSGDSSPQSASEPSPQSPLPWETKTEAADALATVRLPFKCFIYAMFVLLGSQLAWKYRLELLAALANWIQQVRTFRQALLARLGHPAGCAVEDGTQATRPSRLADFTNPFAGGPGGLSSAQLVRYGFAAIEAWARDHGHPRREA
jgi:hypothetical protein